MHEWLFLIALTACTTTQQEDVPSTVLVDAVGATCPAAADAMATISRAEVGGVVETGANSSCTIDGVLSVADSTMQATALTSCCYATVCDPPVTLADSAVLFEATCQPLACAESDLSTFTPAVVAAALARYLPACTLDPASTTPAATASVNCWYAVDERETCHSGGPGS